MNLYDLIEGIWAILVTTVLTAEVIMWLWVLGLTAIAVTSILAVRRFGRRSGR